MWSHLSIGGRIYSGLTRKACRFEIGDKATLFFYEVADITIELR